MFRAPPPNGAKCEARDAWVPRREAHSASLCSGQSSQGAASPSHSILKMKMPHNHNGPAGHLPGAEGCADTHTSCGEAGQPTPALTRLGSLGHEADGLA